MSDLRRKGRKGAFDRPEEKNIRVMGALYGFECGMPEVHSNFTVIEPTRMEVFKGMLGELGFILVQSLLFGIAFTCLMLSIKLILGL